MYFLVLVATVLRLKLSLVRNVIVYYSSGLTKSTVIVFEVFIITNLAKYGITAVTKNVDA